MDEVVPLSAPVGGMCLGDFPLGLYVPVPLEHIVGLGLLHMLQHKGEAVLSTLKERLGDLHHETRRIGVVVVFAGEIALRQVGILFCHVRIAQAFSVGQIRDQGVEARSAGVFQQGAHGIFQRDSRDDRFLRHLAALQLFRIVHAQRELVPVHAAKPLVRVIEPGLVRAGVPVRDRHLTAGMVPVVLIQIGIHPLRQKIRVEVAVLQHRGRKRLRQRERFGRSLFGKRGQVPRLHREHKHQSQYHRK